MGTSLKDRLPPESIAPAGDGEIYMYRVGPLSMSVCAPGVLNAEQVATAISKHHPTGLDHGWSVAEDTHFASGETNPCQCQEDADRKHWLLDC
jgi:hypothetical protein